MLGVLTFQSTMVPECFQRSYEQSRLWREMRGLSSLSNRGATLLRNLRQESYAQLNVRRPMHSNIKSLESFDQSVFRNRQADSEGNLSSSNAPIVADNQKNLKLRDNLIDLSYISRILSRKDWFSLISHELKAGRIKLNTQFIVRVLQNQENPVKALRFYIWVSNIDKSFSQSKSIRVALASIFYRKGPIILSVELLQQIKTSGLPVTEELLCLLIGSWGRLGLAKYCTEVFGQISFLGHFPSTRLYNAVIDAFVKSNSLELAYLKFQQMHADNCTPDRFTYNILIHGVCKLGIVDEGLRLVKQMETVGCSPNVYTYTILIDGFCNSKRIDEAFGILETMKERKVVPNAATIRSLVHGVFDCLPPGKAFEFLSDFALKKRVISKLVCNTVLYCLANSSMAKEAAIFLRKAVEKGHLPDGPTLNIAMASIIKALDLGEACTIFNSLIQKGVKPSFNTYMALVEAAYKAGNIEVGDIYLDQMVRDRFFSDLFSYNMVIDCLCKAKRMDKASEIFRELIRGFSPSLVTFNTLIAGYCRKGDVKRAKELLELMLKHGFMPDIFTFNSMIDGLCRARQLKYAFDCFAEMVEWDVRPDTITYNILIRYLCLIGHCKSSVELFRKMQSEGISPDTFSFNSLIQYFCLTNKIQKAEKLFKAMLRMGLNPDRFTYTAFIKALCECRRIAEAKELFALMEVNGFKFDSYISNLISDASV